MTSFAEAIKFILGLPAVAIDYIGSQNKIVLSPYGVFLAHLYSILLVCNLSASIVIGRLGSHCSFRSESPWKITNFAKIPLATPVFALFVVSTFCRYFQSIASQSKIMLTGSDRHFVLLVCVWGRNIELLNLIL
jgi:hypothetical protein